MPGMASAASSSRLGMSKRVLRYFVCAVVTAMSASMRASSGEPACGAFLVLPCSRARTRALAPLLARRAALCAGQRAAHLRAWVHPDRRRRQVAGRGALDQARAHQPPEALPELRRQLVLAPLQLARHQVQQLVPAQAAMLGQSLQRTQPVDAAGRGAREARCLPRAGQARTCTTCALTPEADRSWSAASSSAHSTAYGFLQAPRAH